MATGCVIDVAAAEEVGIGMGGACVAGRRLWVVGGAMRRPAGGGGATFLGLADDGGGGSRVVTVVCISSGF